MLPIFPEITSVDKEMLKEYPLRAFDGKIVVVDNLDLLQKAVDDLAQQKVIGFDTETRPSFKKGLNNGVALLQLSTRYTAYLIQLKKVGISSSLIKVLSNPKIIKAGVAIRDDIKILKKIRGFVPEGFVELQSYVKEFGIENFGLKRLTALVLGFRISKSQQLSNWEADTLTPAQQIYAATDAWTGFEIYSRLQQFVD